jgi:cell division protein FtsW (lipid II flippase)
LIRIYLLLVVLLLAFWLLRSFIRTPPAVIAENIKKTGLIIIALIFLVLAVTGRLNWLIAVIGVAVASFARALPLLLRYAPQLQRLWAWFKYSKNQSSHQQRQHKSAPGRMSRGQAFNVLGLKEGATRDEIIQAHRRLIQKNHPDRGGSDYIAAQINEAKQILLNS